VDCEDVGDEDEDEVGVGVPVAALVLESWPPQALRHRAAASTTPAARRSERARVTVCMRGVCHQRYPGDG
jgi:hypothetical protein